MTFMHVRITPKGNDEVLPLVLRVIEGKHGGGYVMVKELEDSENEHYHVHMSLTGTKTQFRNALTRAFAATVGGNKHYSTKECDLKMLQYVCKGDSSHPMPRGSPPDVVKRDGLFYTDERIKDAHDAYWNESREIIENRDVAFPTYVENVMKMNHTPFTILNTVTTIVDVSIKKGKTLNNFYIEGVAKYIVAKNNKGYKKSLINHIVRRCQFEDEEVPDQD